MVNAVRAEPRRNLTDTTSLIFDCMFACIVPLHSTRSIEELRVRGFHHSGVRQIDSRHHNSRTRVMISIADMVTRYRDGIAIAVCDPADIQKVYEYIQKHLFAWTDYMDGAGQNLKPPLDDLIALDQFADSLFYYVKFEPKKTAEQDFFEKYRGKRASFDKNKLFDPEKLRAFLENDPAKVEQRRQEAIYGKDASVTDNGDSVSVRGKGTVADVRPSQFDVRERESFSDFFHDRRREEGSSRR